MPAPVRARLGGLVVRASRRTSCDNPYPPPPCLSFPYPHRHFPTFPGARIFGGQEGYDRVDREIRALAFPCPCATSFEWQLPVGLRFLVIDWIASGLCSLTYLWPKPRRAARGNDCDASGVRSIGPGLPATTGPAAAGKKTTGSRRSSACASRSRSIPGQDCTKRSTWWQRATGSWASGSSDIRPLRWTW